MDWLSRVSLLGLCLVPIIIPLTECGRLNDYILDYQPLTYDRSTVHRNHQRVRRSAENHLYVRFNAFGRHFQLKLWPSEGVFSPQHQAYIEGKGLHRPDTSFIYQGHVKGEPNSRVHVSVHNGSLEGEVHVSDNTFHIEPAAKYISEPAFHTIIYPESHLDTDPYRVRREAESGSCGVDHHHIQEFMEKTSRLEEDSSTTRTKRETWREERPHNMYSENSNRDKRSFSKESTSSSSRQKRSLGTRNACPLHLRADPRLFNYFKFTKHGRSVENEQAEEEILAFFANHVNAMSSIYKNTVFQTYNGEMKNTGLSFVIHRSTIMKNCTDVDSDYCSNNLDVSNYLELTSRENHDLYCLVFTFTYRDFSGGTLGLAWVATESSTQSGVCGRYSKYSGGQMKSLNTGIVTIINFGKTVPNRVSQLTFSHEAGHNFGSPHDIGSAECAPFGTTRSDANNGNYIMFPSATSGNKVNNDKFSICSRDNMTRIIQQVVDSRRHMCFVASGQAFCGNKITEEGEMCDCGFGICSSNTCCTGRDENIPGSGCLLTSSSVCSPDSGPCCQKNCTFVLADTVVCEPVTDCKEQSLCNGANFTCPEPTHKPNGTYCNDYSKVCNQGECIGSVCQNIVDTNGLWEECFMTSETGQDSELCFVACRSPTTKECISSVNGDALVKAENAPFRNMLRDAAQKKTNSTLGLSITLPPGSACNNFRGYCDTFSKCQLIDAQGPFNQLTNMIFDPVTLNKVKDWIVEHWWAVLLMCLGLVVFMGVFVKVFGYNTPSQDPIKKRQQQQRQQQQQQAAARQAQPRPQPRSQPRSQGATSYDSAPPPYSTEMDMAHYPRSQQGRPQQYDRLAPHYNKNRV